MAKRKREKMKAKEQRHNRARKSGGQPEPVAAGTLPAHLRHATAEWKSFYEAVARSFG